MQEEQYKTDTMLPAKKGSSILLLLTTSPRGGLGQLTQHFNRCLPALEGAERVYLHHVYVGDSDWKSPSNTEVPKPSRAIKLVKRLHGMAASTSMDLRVLLHSFKSMKPVPAIPQLDTVMVGPTCLADDFLSDIKRATKAQQLSVLTDSKLSMEDPTMATDLSGDNSDDEVAENIVLGGTFDRLHAGHKILLAEAMIRCTQSLTVGVTDGAMLESKVLPELIQPCHIRISHLLEYLKECDPSLSYSVVAIKDPFGPSIEKPELQMIVGSEETRGGCVKVNEKRKERGLGQLKIKLVEVEKDPNRENDSVEEEKVSSSSARIRLLGTMVRPPLKEWSPDSGPYVIGLTGPSATGKTSIAKRLEKLGAKIIDCDKLGHKAYEPGSNCYTEILKAFGKEVRANDGKIDRKALGHKVFGSEEKRKRLESLVWPEILRLTQRVVAKSSEEVVVVDAAVLLRAGWHKTLCHQVWGTVLPHKTTLSRIIERDGKTEKEAQARMAASVSGQDVAATASVIFCTAWAGEFTQSQVEKAWEGLRDLMNRQKKKKAHR